MQWSQSRVLVLSKISLPFSETVQKLPASVFFSVLRRKNSEMSSCKNHTQQARNRGGGGSNDSPRPRWRSKVRSVKKEVILPLSLAFGGNNVTVVSVQNIHEKTGFFLGSECKIFPARGGGDFPQPDSPLPPRLSLRFLTKCPFTRTFQPPAPEKNLVTGLLNDR